MEVGEVRVIDGKLSLITHGQTYGSHGISNFWAWRTIRKDGSLGAKYKGYNNGEHTISKPIKHEVVIKVDLFDVLKVKNESLD